MRRVWAMVLVAVPLTLMSPVQSAGEESSAEEAQSEESADEEPTKEELVRELLELTDAAQAGMQVANRMLEMFKKQRPEVPDEFWDEFEKKMNEKKQEFIDMLVPIYEKYYTKDELQQLIEFYKSPLGRKLVKKRPKIMKESMKAGKKWGRQLGQKLQRKLRKKGYTK